MRWPLLYLASLSCWFIFFQRGLAQEQSDNITGILEVDLVFPRNETYNPQPMMPIVLSYRNNPQLLYLFRPTVSYEIRNLHNNSGPIDHGKSNWVLPAVGEDPFIEVEYLRDPVDTEGTWVLDLWLSWSNCYRKRTKPGLPDKDFYQVTKTKIANVTFTTEGPLKQIDLVAATSNKTCPFPIGIAINVTDTMEPPEPLGWSVCPIVASSPTKADSCATLDHSTASTIDARIASFVCDQITDKLDVIDCRARKINSAVQVVSGGATCLALMLGILIYMHRF